MSEDKIDLVAAGVTAYKAGDKARARSYFAQAVKTDPNSERAWGWLYNVCNTDEERIHCLTQIVRLNPRNSKASQLLHEMTSSDYPLEGATLPPTTNVNRPSVNVVSTYHSASKLTCPSCGGELSSPNNLGVAFCSYCGSKVMLQANDSMREQKALGYLQEMRDIAFKAGNYDETIKYCNNILEKDPANYKTWIIKARAVCNSSTEFNDRFEEGLEYLRKAVSHAPSDDREIDETFLELNEQFFKWYLMLAVDNNNISTERLFKRLDGSDYAIKSMEYSLKALKCKPGNFQALESIELLTRSGAILGIKYGEDVEKQLLILKVMRTKINAEERLPGLRTELKRAQSDLEKQKNNKGVFSGGKIKNLEATIKKLENDIAIYEKWLTYEPPKAML